MCRHVINAQVSCLLGGKWFDCHECYLEEEGKAFDLEAHVRDQLILACKVCRQQFEKDLRIFSDLDAQCPHCKNVFVIPAMTPESCMIAETEHAVDAALAETLSLQLKCALHYDVDFDHLIEVSAKPAFKYAERAARATSLSRRG